MASVHPLGSAAGTSRIPGRHAYWQEMAYVFFMLGITTAATLAALILAVLNGVDGFYLTLFVVYLFFTTLGVTAGLHRYFTHKSFSCKRWFEVLLAVLGINAGQDFFVRWIYVHRIHHRHTDVEGDPHSPYVDQRKSTGGLFGLYYAHIGWLFHREPSVDPKVVPDLLRDPLLLLLDRYSPLITFVGLLLPGFIALVYEASAFSFLQGVLWGGFVRLFVMYHVSWGVNSLGHSYGGKVPGQRHGARNNIVLGIITLGDGWHANHHEHAASARHGFGWQLDGTYWVLKACERMGWVWGMKLPSEADQRAFAAALR